VKPIRVYIAGPYTKGDVAVNVRNAVVAASELWRLGFSPYVPHLTHFWHLVDPHPYEDWLALDLQWLPACDCVLRLPGESTGADGECAEALRIGLPVFHSHADLLRHFAEAAA
jgi:hypothetical protein